MRRGSVARGLLVAASLFCLQVGCAPQEPPTEGEPIEIGVIAPLTGSLAVWGENTVRGIQLAADEVNAAGGVSGRKIELVVEDSKCEPEEAVKILRSLIAQRHIPVVLGVDCSADVLAMAPVAQDKQVVLFSTGASNPEISHAGDFVFRNWPSDALQGRLTARYARDIGGFQRAAILYVDNAYGQGLDQVFGQELEAMGGQVVLSEAYPEGATDVRAQLARIKAQSPDLLYLPAYTKELPIILQQAKAIGLQAHVIASETFDDPGTIEAAGAAAEGVVFPSPAAFDTQRPQGAKFQQAFEKKFGEPPGVTADTGYDALNMVAQAMEHGATTGMEIKDYLSGLEGYEGVAGETTFDRHGDAPKNVTFYEVRQGRPVALEQTPAP